eukprot:CAMPEP_0202964562 /NCGR_PEP_ID=MMETSP1396-20130829/8641_1 /ASSEMBLY_ACC=CAM_ASM_000872 /TAXON_ID= /ORGANISM="Pseudokeronopsis sp., Strain Brazil" /LENGTH=100 /DNA_ID=CAMNT_0049686753 /DNA_START=18 /DNA_END=320 /DNA_ORIENTATION=-
MTRVALFSEKFKIQSKESPIEVAITEARELISEFNELEIEKPEQQTSKEYIADLLLHYLVLDLNNARFLWKRIPKALKEAKDDSGLALASTWEIGKALIR